MKELLKKLCLTNGLPGHEEDVREVIRREVEPYADKLEVDPLGSLYVFKKGEKTPAKPRLVTAHMDEIGCVVRTVVEDGYVRMLAVGSMDPRVLVGRRVVIGNQGEVHGVAGLRAIHLTTKEDRKIAPTIFDLYIDIGAYTKEEAEKMVHKTQPIYFDSQFVEFGDQRLKGKAMEGRLGCAVMCELIKEKPAYDTWYAFTVGGEVFERGARVAAQRINPGICLNLVASPAGDVPGVSAQVRSCAQEQGAVVYLKDQETVYTRRLIEQVTAAADKAGVNWQYRTSDLGTTDAGLLHKSNGGCEICTIGAPVRYLHSASGMVYYPDLLAMKDMARLFINEVTDNV